MGMTRPVPIKSLEDVTVEGRCSVCERRFRIQLTDGDLPQSAYQELKAFFEDHACKQDANQSAAPGCEGTDEQALEDPDNAVRGPR